MTPLVRADGVGVHYVSAFIKQMTAKIDDNTKVMCKRKGLKLMLRINNAKGEGLLRRLEHCWVTVPQNHRAGP